MSNLFGGVINMKMYGMLAVAVGLAVLAGGCEMGSRNGVAGGAAAERGWVPLFNGKNLDGFYTYLSASGKNKDPNGIFKVENGMIHIMDLPPTTATQETGYIATEKRYADFDLKFEYKWGTKKFAPRATVARDSGCHYLFTGPDKIWENAIECQVMEGETGDLYNLNNASALNTTVKSLSDRNKTYTPASEGGVPWAMTGSTLLRSKTMDSATDWNKVEVIVKGNSSTHIVNGVTVNHAEGISTKDGVPITEGKIAFQSEAAEMWYRNIMIKPLK
jgi:hypothetical protein